MEESIIHSKKMVFETLMETRKPLMAKKIAANIRHKYGGYRISKFFIRDIIWKELKGMVEYDDVNYTYWLSETTKDEYRKIHVKEEKEKCEEEVLEIEAETGNSLNRILDKLNSELYIPNKFKKFIKTNYLNINTGNKRFDELISSVVKDNKITKNEEVFLKQKTLELGLSIDLIEKSKELLNSNNPYLDNIIHIIFEDGKITEEELLFLREKELENNFSKNFVNQRFWQIGICHYLKELCEYSSFNKIIKLWHVGSSLEFKLISSDSWLFTKIDIHEFENFNDVIDSGALLIEKFLKLHILKHHDFQDDYLYEKLYKEINLKIENIPNKTDNTIDLKMNIIKIIQQEKMRIGDPASDLLAENIIFRIQNKEWD